ncbi:MAG: acyl--CoA ligase [Lachnospiraceae bacterium]|jgi:long-chain acyl-CoA synthetase|nr:acyl--CoA ligase [Lachnospiraceae bacterium]
MKKHLMLHEEYQGLTVFQMLEKMAGKFQERQVLSYWSGGQAISVSYTDFFQDVRRLAAYFDGLGLCGHRVVIDGRNTYEQITALFAAMSMGAAAVPLCFDLPLEDLQQLVRRLNPALIIYDEESRELLPDIRLNARTLACLGASSIRSVLDGNGLLYQDDGRVSLSQPALILATSGSSSQPKLVVHSHQSFQPHGNQPLQSSIFVLPMYHVVVTRLFNDMAGGTPSCLSNFRQALFDIQWYHPQKVFATPNLITLLLKQDRMGALDIGTFRSITNLGAPETSGMTEALNARGIFYCSVYGTTEACGAITYSVPGHYRAGSVGKIGPWNEVRISDQGEILVRGNDIMQGYLDDPETTGEALADGWYHTGDTGYIDEDGFLYIIGRMKNIIILSNGENVSAEAVEKKLIACEEIKEVIVLGENDQISAHIWCGEGRKEEGEDQVRAFITRYNETVPSYQAVRNIVFREKPFPKTTSGKIKR